MPRAKHASKAKKTTATPQAAATPAESKSILIVDNDEILVRVLALKFKKAGFHATVCHDGRKAIDALKQNVYHAVVLDLMMPIVNGYEVLEANRKTPNAATPVFVMSGVANADAPKKALSLGARQFFVKFNVPLRDVVEQITAAVLKD